MLLGITKVMVTGSNGFIGSHLVEALAGQPYNRVCAVFHKDNTNILHMKNGINLHKANLTDKGTIGKLLAEFRADMIFHLASVSNIPDSWKHPSIYFDTNVKGTVNLLEAVKETLIDPTIVVTCSSGEYGSASQVLLREDSPLRPTSPYAVSKVAQDLMAELYGNTYGLKIVRVRPFFIIGPRQLTGACADFARGIVSIEQGHQEMLQAGNLSPVLDVLDVRDAVAALLTVAEHGEKGAVYNLCSGKGYSIKQILDIMMSHARCRPEVIVDPKKLRHQDHAWLVGDNSKLRQLGWVPKIPLETTLKDILAFWRKELGGSSH